jgi:glycerophosphoryl diester phosphodiesterase
MEIGRHTRKPLRIAHRGMPRRVRENTLAGFALALDAGADGIELDVHATADGHVVVHHDPALPDGLALADLTLDDLRARDSREHAEPIPTLDEVCALVAGRAELFVEIKGDGIENRVLAVLEGYRGAKAIHSFDRALMQRLASSGANVRLGLLSEEYESDIVQTMIRHRALDLWPYHRIVTPLLLEQVHAHGGRVIPWTVNDPGEARRFALLGVDGVCTDDVTILP